jgi:hypothetical protein
MAAQRRFVKSIRVSTISHEALSPNKIRPALHVDIEQEAPLSAEHEHLAAGQSNRWGKSGQGSPSSYRPPQE